MNWYVVSYDLRRELSNEDYLRLYEWLRTAVDFCHALQSVWIIQTPRSAEDVTRILLDAGVLDENDGFLVLEITGYGAYRKVRHEVIADWLDQRLTRV